MTTNHGPGDCLHPTWKHGSQKKGTHLEGVLFRRHTDSAELFLSSHWIGLGVVIVLAGLALRLYYAQTWYLNPDEALYYLAAAQDPGTWMAWNPKAALVTHPPLFTWLLHAALHLGRDPLIVRSISIISGALFPWFVMLWVRRFAGSSAGLCALIILTFSPALIDLSVEVRAYPLSFLFVSISLNLLERALARDAVRDFAWFYLFLCLAILTEYSIVWYVLASSLYAIGRFLAQRTQPQIWRTWLVGQTVALILYAILYVTQIKHWTGAIASGAVNGWLRPGYLQPGDNVAVFAVTRSLGQLDFLFGSMPAAVALGILFLWGVYRRWRVDPAGAAFLVLPFAVACLGAVFHLLPYSATRHTAFLSIFAAAGIGSAVAILCGGRILPLLLAALVVIPSWLLAPIQVPMTIPAERHRSSQMHDAIQFLHSHVPADSIIVTDVGTAFMLTYDLQSRDYSIQQTDPYRIWHIGALQFVAFPTFNFENDRQLSTALSQVRHDFHPSGDLWVAAGGFEINISNPAARSESFQKAIAEFRAE